MKKYLIFTVFLILLGISSSPLKAQSWNNTYSDVTGSLKESISGIARMGSGHHVIQSRDGTVSKIDINGDIVWSIKSSPGLSAEESFMLESVAVIGNKILVINRHNWQLLEEVGGVPEIVRQGTWSLEGSNYIGYPCRVKAINGNFIICGGLYQQLGEHWGSSDFLMRVNTDGDIVWSKSYAETGNAGGPDIAVNLITDVVMSTAENWLFCVDYHWFQGHMLETTSIAKVSFDTGELNERRGINLQSFEDVGPDNPEEVGFWGIEMQGKQIRMVGHSKKYFQDIRIALFCHYDWATDSIVNIRRWEIPDEELQLTGIKRVGIDYYISGVMRNYGTSGMLNSDGYNVMVKSNGEGNIIYSSYVLDNTYLKQISPLGAFSSSTFYVDDATFMFGGEALNNKYPLIRKAPTLDDLSCKTNIELITTPWVAEIWPYIFGTSPVGNLFTPASIDPLEAVKTSSCCLYPSFNLIGDDIICTGESVIIEVNAEGDGLTYEWSSSDGGLFTVIADNQIEVDGMQPPDTYTFSVTITDENGCAETIWTYITIAPSPDVSEINGTIYCLGMSYILPGLDGGAWSGPSVIAAMDGVTYYFSPATAGVYILTYVDEYGCSAEVTLIVGGPTVEIDGALDLCESSPTVLTALIGMYPDAVDILWSPGGETTTSITVTEPGIYTVTVTGSESPYCSTVKTVEVTDGSWHQTTENSFGTEATNDVVTDAAGNVYVTGVFTEKTELNGGNNPNILLDPTYTSWLGNMYVAKYNSCGTLIWAANTTESPNCRGNSIVVDEENNMVYVTGNIQQYAIFHSAQSAESLCTSGYSQSVTPVMPDVTSFIAQYDLSTGCLYFAASFFDGYKTDSRTITCNETTGDIFVGGKYKPTALPGEEYAFMHKFSPTVDFGISNSLGGAIWTVIDNVNTANTNSVVNDLDFDEGNNRLYAIGTFNKELNLFNGLLETIVNPLFNDDAFIVSYNDLGGSTNLFDIRDGNSDVHGFMEGNGISVEKPTGAIFLTGTFRLAVDDPFHLLTEGINPLAIADPTDYAPRSYMIGLNLNGGMIPWSRQMRASPSANAEVHGQDVVTKDGNVYFLNEFTGSFIEALAAGGDGLLLRPFIGLIPGNTHIGIVSYTTGGSRNWFNVTKSPFAWSSDHNGLSVTADLNGHCYIAGNYTNRLKYYYGSPSSGTLIHSGVTGGYNAFILRVQNSSGELQLETPNIEETTEAVADFMLRTKIYPNPTKDIFHLEIENFDLKESIYQLNVFNLLGQKVLSFEVSTQHTVIDLSPFVNGVYLLHLSNGVNSFQYKITKF